MLVLRPSARSVATQTAPSAKVINTIMLSFLHKLLCTLYKINIQTRISVFVNDIKIYLPKVSLLWPPE